MHQAIERIITEHVRTAWAPPPRMSVSEWAERYRYLSPEASAEPGLWRNSRAPHLVAPMDCLSPYSDTERVVLWVSSQTGKTETILNFIGYIVDLDPGPILAIQPNVTPMGEAFSKDRVSPMLRDSPTLAAKTGQAKARASASTITHKTFTGGHLTIAGANSPAGLASRPIRYLVCDELDRWEITKEGDPLLLARKRLQTFRARRASKELVVSSPTYADVGICAEYGRCDQQWEWHLACLHCGETQYPTLKNFACETKTVSDLRYICAHCGAEHTLDQSDRVKAGGRWVCGQDGPGLSVGFRMNQWSSPFARWDDTWQEWAAAGDDPGRRQAVVNTVFAEPWEGEGEQIEPHALSLRAEDWGDAVPAAVLGITVGVDVQVDRLELEVVGWGPAMESWSLAYEILAGEPTAGEVWDELTDFLSVPWKTADGRTLTPVATCIDSGAYTQHVYGYVKRRRDQRIIPIKGADGLSRDPIAGSRADRLRRMAKRARDGRPPEILGVDALKLTLHHYLRAAPGKAGYCHFPLGRDPEWYSQLTGERLISVIGKDRRAERRWVQSYRHVEALDCRVYAMAAALLADVQAMRAAPAAPVREIARQTEAKPASNPRRPPSRLIR